LRRVNRHKMSDLQSIEKPSVTVVIVPRERFSPTPAVLDALYEHTDYPFDLVCVDGNSPPAMRDYLVRQSRRHQFRLIRTERYVSPNQARNLGFAQVNSEWVVFLDNDCEVRPGWLSAMIRCAGETGAAAVAPIYFEGSWENQRIHMAGGTAEITGTGASRVYKASNCHEKCHYPTVRDQIRRAAVDIFEMHCVLLNVQTLNDVGPLDEGLLSAFEHDDLSLRFRQVGASIYLEPSAKVTYTFGSLDKHDAAYAKLRWSDDWNRRTVAHFRERWSLDPQWGEASIEWCNDHRRRILRETRTLPNMARKAIRKALVNLLGQQRLDALRGRTRFAGES